MPFMIIVSAFHKRDCYQYEFHQLLPRDHPLSWIPNVQMGNLTFSRFSINAHQIKYTCCVCCSNSTSNFTSCSRSREHTITTSSVSMITRSCTPITATNRLSPKTRVFLVDR